MQTCSNEEFRCGSGQCIPLDWQCDGEQDCPEGLDEWDNLCSKYLFLSHYCQLFPVSCLDKNKTEESKCKDGEFRCHADGACIPGNISTNQNTS